MKTQGFVRLSALVLFLFIVSLACQPTTPTQAPPVVITQIVTQVAPPIQQPVNNNDVTTEPPVSTGGWTTFTDKDDLFSISIPSDWTYEQTKEDDYYIDSFYSPDEQALIENIVYDDGTSFGGGLNGRFALYLLNTFYSSTGKEGDIRVSDDAIQKDGSERLTWESKDGDYSGISFFEVRNRTTFLMFTVEYMNDAEDQYLETLNQVISSYDVP